ncbi:MAG: ABC transporter ATP-binding protein [Bacillota bacterium]|nr:ABC transporter ATP-binding protein [Bacillota bacterium]NLV63656.1 ABC transporter ATP-binding protein [Clostridiaceae bacterium]
MKIIEVKNLVKSFDDFNAVNSISFDVEKREVFGFLGPNGAGKTTTINMLTGLARPTSGEITIAGYDGIKHIKKVQQLIGIVPDESNLYDEMSGFDNLTFCASLYGMKKEVREERAKELLKQFSLEDTGDRPFKAYSKGMKRKLTIAAGIIHNPEILFLDEPTTGIDVESARQIRKMIKNLNDNGTTIFLTTHYIEEAERLCDRIGFIVGGKVIKVSKVQDLMIEAQQENIVEFGIDSNGLNVEKLLTGNFPDITIKSSTDHSIRISSKNQIEIMPFMKLFDNNGIKINEAKVIRPSLEEIFVKITGIEIDKLQKEKEGKQK